MLIELAKLYDVSLEELLHGERNTEMMNKQTEETLYNIAGYTNIEKERLLKNQHFFAWIGVISWLIFLTLQAFGLADEGITEKIASFAAGMAFAMSILALIYSGKYLNRIRQMQKH